MSSHNNISFQVKRLSSRQFSTIIIIFCVAMGLCIYFGNDGFIPVYIMVTAALIIFLLFISKPKKEEVFIEIDNSGIWVHDKQITTWANYKKSYLDVIYVRNANNTKSKKQVLKIEYYKSGENGYFINELNFNGLEDKSEYQTLDAIAEFYNYVVKQFNQRNSSTKRIR